MRPTAPPPADRARRGIAFGLAALIVAGCTTPPAQRPVGEPPVWPPPPDPPRFAWEVTLRAPADILANDETSRLRRAVTGEASPTAPAFEKPAAIAARNGRIYVTDSVRRYVVVFDVPRRQVFQFGIRNPGALTKPIALAIDGAGRVYVADVTLRRVHVYDALGLFLREIGKPDDLLRPTGVAVSRDGNRIYVIDRASNDSDQHRVLVYGADGTRRSEIGTRGAGPGAFNVPVQAATAPDGTLYVLDAGNFRVQAFTPDGKHILSFGSVGAGPGQFARPRGIAVDDDANVYVSDAAYGNVQVFDRTGRLLIAIGQSSIEDAPGRYALPLGVAVDETRRVYVVDQFFAKVEVIRALGVR